MNKKIFTIIMILSFSLIGCVSTKHVYYDEQGRKVIKEKSTQASFNETQSQAWVSYYKALENPPVIAKITDAQGNVISINSQLPPPKPEIRQHQNQYIKPIASVAKFVIGGYVVDSLLSDVINNTSNTIIENSGSGNVDMAKNSDVMSDRSDNSDNSDNSVDNTSDPVVVKQPEYNDPIIVK